MPEPDLERGLPEAGHDADRRLVFHTAWSLTRDWHLAEDVTQDVLWKLESAEAPTAAAARRAWLSKVTVNRCLTLLRSDARRTARESEHPQEGTEMDAANVCEFNEELSVVREALGELEDSHRLPLVLRYFNDFKLREIAKALELPLPTVQSRLDAGLSRLGENLSRLGYASLVPVLGVKLAAIPGTTPAAAGGVIAAAGGGFFKSLKAKLATLVVGTAAAAAVFADFDKNPYADTIAIVVHHGPNRETVDRIDDPKELESVMAKLEFTAFERMHMGIIPPCELDFELKNGDVKRGVDLIDRKTMQDRSGILRMKAGFSDALNALLSKRHGRAIDVLKLEFKETKPSPPWTFERMKGLELASVQVNYRIGKQMWETTTRDPADLARLQAAWSVHSSVSIEELGARGIEAQPIWLGGFRSTLTVTAADGEEFFAWFCSPTELYQFRVGLMEIGAELAPVLGELVEREHGRRISLFEENARDPEREARAAPIAAALGGVAWLAIHDESGEMGEGATTTSLEEAARVTEFMAKHEYVFLPIGDSRGRRTGTRFVLHPASGELPFAVHFLELEPGPVSSVPILSDLVEIEGLGRVWVDNQWKYKGRYEIREAERKRENAAEQERVKRVVEHWDALQDEVLSVTVQFAVGKTNYLDTLQGDDAKRFTRSLEGAVLEKLVRSPQWWTDVLKPLKEGDAGSFSLVPSTDLAILCIVETDDTALLPGIGRIRVKSAGWKVLREAIARGQEFGPDAVRLLAKEAEQAVR